MTHGLQKDCFKHAGKSNDLNRTVIDGIVSGLPDNQSGKGRHKRPYCAYELGKQHGHTEALEEASKSLEQLRLQQSRITR